MSPSDVHLLLHYVFVKEWMVAFLMLKMIMKEREPAKMEELKGELWSAEKNVLQTAKMRDIGRKLSGESSNALNSEHPGRILSGQEHIRGFYGKSWCWRIRLTH